MIADIDKEYSFDEFCAELGCSGTQRYLLQRYLQNFGRPGRDFRLGSKPGSTTQSYMHCTMRQLRALHERVKVADAKLRLQGDELRWL